MGSTRPATVSADSATAGSAKPDALTARQSGLKSCRSCHQLTKLSDDRRCTRCGDLVVSRTPKSLQRTWAFLLAGLFAYVPANTLPIMSTSSFLGNTRDTIISGIMSLMASGSYVVAIIIFVASICIPIVKLIVIGTLALSLQFQWRLSEHGRHHFHALTEFIGRWSMIDVFVVAVLVGLIQLGAIISVTPGMGINCFALSVVFTMLAASSLDSRLLWDKQLDAPADADASAVTVTGATLNIASNEQ